MKKGKTLKIFVAFIAFILMFGISLVTNESNAAQKFKSEDGKGEATLWDSGLLIIDGTSDFCINKNLIDNFKRESIKKVIILRANEIGDYAFWNCTNLSSISIPEGVTRIGKVAFYECSSLTNIQIPNSVKYIEGQAFGRCTNLSNINLGNGVKSFAEEAFFRCDSLVNIVLPDGLETIVDRSFFQCINLERIDIPSSVKSIGPGAFADCAKLTNISVDENNEYYKDIDGVLYTKDEKEIVCYPNGKTEENYVILDNVEVIGDYAFRGAQNLKGIEIPNTVTSIGIRAFENCSGLTSIEIPNGVEEIKTSTFYNCENLENVTIPNSVLSIGKFAFVNCHKLANIVIPNSVTRIMEGAFEICTSLTNVEIPNSVEELGDSVFYNCENLASITIPNSVIKIGKNAIPQTTTINCIEGSQAQEYAENNSNQYTLIEVQDPESPEKVQISNGRRVSGNKVEFDIELPEGSGLRGDANNDGIVDNTDLDVILNYLNSSITLEGQGAFNADYDCNGIINTNDYIALSRDINGITPITLTGTLAGEATKKLNKNSETNYTVVITLPEDIEGTIGVKLNEGIFKYATQNLNEVVESEKLNTIPDSIVISTGKRIGNKVEFNIVLSEGSGLRGDANNDGIVNSVDAILIQRYIANKNKYPLEGQGLFNADYNGDGKINSEDNIEANENVIKWNPVKLTGTLAENATKEFKKNGQSSYSVVITIPENAEGTIGMILNKDVFKFASQNTNEEIERKKLNIIEDRITISNGRINGNQVEFDIELSEESGLNGDVNNNGKVENFDANLIGKYIANKKKYPLEGQELFNADYNGDGEIDVSDSLEANENVTKWNPVELTGTLAGKATMKFNKNSETSYTVVITVPENVDGTIGVKINKGIFKYQSRVANQETTSEEVNIESTSEEPQEPQVENGKYRFVLRNADKNNIGITGGKFSVKLEDEDLSIMGVAPGTWISEQENVELEKEFTYQITENETANGYKNLLGNKYIKIKAKLDEEGKLAKGFIDGATLADQIKGFVICNENGEIVKDDELYEKINVKFTMEWGIQELEVTIESEEESTTPEDPDPENPDPENPDPENPDPEDPTPDEDIIKVEKYKLEDGIISGIQPETTVNELMKNIHISNKIEYKLLSKDGKEIKQEDKVTTGCKIQLQVNGKTVEYLLAVKGDVDGDGKADINDLFKINKHRLNKVKLQNEYLKAGDIDGDGIVGVNDIFKLNKYRLGKINQL